MRVWGVALSGLVVGLLGAEAGLRGAVALGWPQTLADPVRYADPLSDDAYWVLRARGGRQPALRRHTRWEQDPTLGWTPDRRNLNPMGGWQSPRRPDGAERAVAVFGDSFVYGSVPDGERLPDQLQALSPGTHVLNYGVAGYGLDQILLRLEDRLPVLGDASVIIGVLTTDLDRCLLSLRSGPKPRFQREGDSLRLVTEGLALSHAEALAARSGPVSLLWRLAARAAAAPEAHRAEVEALAPLLFARLRQACAGRSCQVVVFEWPEELAQPPGWRARLLLDGVGLPVLLARDALGPRPEDAYGPDRHLSPAGNRLVAAALLDPAAQEGPARRPTGRVLVAEEEEVGDPFL